MFSSAIQPLPSLTARIWNLPIRRARPPLGLAVLATGFIWQGGGTGYEDAFAVFVSDVVEFAFKVVLGAGTILQDFVLDLFLLADDAVSSADAAVVQGLGESGGGEPW
jgi:hypothetical protein